MRIGIIGAGQIGGTLTRRLKTLGHDVLVANSKDPLTLSALAKETGAMAVWALETIDRIELLIITIPEKDIPNLPDTLFDEAPKALVVVDTGNYYPRQRDGYIAGIEDGTTESAWVAKQLGRPIIKAFNNIQAQHLMDMGKPPGKPGRIALPVAGDDHFAKEMVMRLIDELGFDPVDSGDLSSSWRQQPGTPVYGADLDKPSVQEALFEATQKRSPEWCAIRG
jgi:predicted dinucleotide-binding enzyme